ncbi:uncharacterized protein LOC134281341 [Saccostrea cucullata]|uniref:uncharacterized protein LOC134281341 n=1 Tax=Saccostrea cuccullata TaxID=36930 RepID=UPI002ED656FA
MKKNMKESEELRKQLDLERLQSDTRKLNISKSIAEFEVLEGELEKHRKCWHQEVDDIFDKHKSLITSMRENAIKSLTEQNHAPKHVIERKLQIIKENKDIIRSKSVSKVVNYKTEFQEYKASPKEIDAIVTVPSLKVKTDRGKELDMEYGEGELIYTDTDSVIIVRSGMTENLIKTPEGWEPWGLCCTNSGDILVNMVTNAVIHDHKIVRYAGQKAVQDIQKDSDGNPFFQSGNFIICLAENRNGDICASDGNAKKVVVMDKEGAVRFRYTGYPAKRKKYFCPEHIATDSKSQIIETDHNNDCLHILDQNGEFLQCVDDCGLDTPGGLSIDNKGRCWVGLHSGKLKVISLNM